jgi:hypothetical protein
MAGVVAASAGRSPETRQEVVTAATAGLATARRLQELSHTPPPKKKHRMRGTAITLTLLGAAAVAGHRAARRFDSH